MPDQLGDLRPYVVKILNPFNEPGGTGFVCHPEGYLLTCWHVLLSWKEVGKRQGMVLLNGKRIRAEWVREQSAEEADLAVLKLLHPANEPQTSLRYLPLDTDWRVKVGDRLTSFGYPAGQFAETGIPTTFSLQGLTPTEVENLEIFPLVGFNLDDINDGYSGAPVINETTQKVIGLIHAKHHETQAFIVPLRRLVDAWPGISNQREKEPDEASVEFPPSTLSPRTPRSNGARDATASQRNTSGAPTGDPARSISDLELANFINEYFSTDEIGSLCFTIAEVLRQTNRIPASADLDIDSFTSRNVPKETIARAMVRYFRRRMWTPFLVEALKAERPDSFQEKFGG